MKNKTQSLSCNIQLDEFSSFKGDIWLPPNLIYDLVIDYPLSNPVCFKIKTGKRGLGSNGLIGKITRAYRKIYFESDVLSTNKYGIWGHSLEDLAIERIKVDHHKRKILLDIGS